MELQKDFYTELFSFMFMKSKKTLSKIKKNIYVKDVMSKNVLNLDKTESVYKAIKVMAKESVSTIVTHHNKKPIGILTERDLVKKLLLKGKDPKKTKIIDIMSKDPVIIHPDDSILRASNKMKNKHVRKLVVVDDSGNLVGIISQTDIIESMYMLDEAYSRILWNPWFTIIMFMLVALLFFLNYVIFRS